MGFGTRPSHSCARYASGAITKCRGSDGVLHICLSECAVMQIMVCDYKDYHQCHMRAFSMPKFNFFILYWTCTLLSITEECCTRLANIVHNFLLRIQAIPLGYLYYV